jgi:cytochrome c oxidase cbb3-type subunit III
MRIISIIALIAVAGCNRIHAPQTGAPPAVEIPVGPEPGPKTERELPKNPFGRDRVAIQAGYQLFAQYNCGGCHGDHAGGGMGPSLRDQRWIYGSDDAHIFSSIVEGRGHGMPSWGTRIPEEQLWKIVSYIESLRTNDEPDPPSPPPAPPNP